MFVRAERADDHVCYEHQKDVGDDVGADGLDHGVEGAEGAAVVLDRPDIQE